MPKPPGRQNVTPDVLPGDSDRAAKTPSEIAESHSAGEQQLTESKQNAGMVADARVRTRREPARRRSEESGEKFLRLIDQVEAGIAQTDLTGRFTLTNERYREIVGRSAAELKQLRMQDLTHPDDVPGSLERFQHMVDSGAPFVTEMRYVRPDGSIVWAQNSVSRLDDNEGKPRGVAVVTIDITQRRFAEHALRESEARFRNMADHAPVMVWTTEPDGTCSYLSQSWYDFTGQTPETGLGFGWTDAVHPGDRKVAEETFLAANEKREPFRLEYRLRGQDGAYHWTIDSATPWKGDGGEFLGYIGSVIDISERRATERDLEAARNEAQALFQVTESLAEAKLDLKTLVQRLTDHATELVGARFGAFFYNVVNESGEAYLLYALSGAPKEAFAKFGLPRNTPIFEMTFSGKGVVRLDDVKADSRYGTMAPHYGMPKGHLPVTSYLAVPVVSRRGEVFGGLFFGHPEPARFTEQHERMVIAMAANAAIAMDNARLYEAARSNEARFRAIFDSADVSIWEEDFTAVKQLTDRLKTEHGSGLRKFLEANSAVVQEAIGLVRLLDVNPATLRMFGASSKDELLDSLSTIFLPETQAVFIAELMALAEGRRLLSAETALRAADGRRIDVLFTIAFPPGDAGGRVLVTLTDISARKLIEAEREARVRDMERSLGFSERFVGILGHDLRNPLGAIITASDLLLRRETSERIARPIQRILTSAQRMTRMIEQILDLTRARIGGGIGVEAASMDLHQLASQLVGEFEEAAPRHIVLESAGNVRGEWDSDRLAQVISNLLGNALEHGEPDQSVRLTLDGSDGAVVRFSIWNAGAIPETLLPTLFDPFRRATATGSYHKSKGLGLGLYIAQQIVQAHAGLIDVMSSAIDGTTFSVTLPRRMPPRPNAGFTDANGRVPS